MGFFARYVAYIKDNPKGYWFKRRLFGWGWDPARWQGWATLVGFLVLIVGNAFRLIPGLEAEDPRVVVEFFIETVVLVALLLLICYWTGETPRWSWGFPDETKKDKDVVD